MQSSVYIAFCLSFAGFNLAWSPSSLAVDLAWPPVGNQGTVNNKRVRQDNPNFVPDAFPCWSIPPPSAASSRTNFPLKNGRLQYQLTNNSASSANDNFISDVYLGQFSNDASSAKDGWAYTSTQVIDDFASGSLCSYEVDVANVVANVPAFDLQLLLNNTSLVGVDLTIGVRIVHFNGNGDNEQEMYQCSYVRIVDNDSLLPQAASLCNQVGSTSSSGTVSSTAVSQASTVTSMALAQTSTYSGVGTASSNGRNTATATSTVVLSGVNNDDDSGPNVTGIAVGVSLGVTAALLILGFAFYRIRKNKNSKPTVALGFWTAGLPGDSGPNVAKSELPMAVRSKVEGDTVADVSEKEDTFLDDKKKDQDGTESSQASVHSEPPLVYENIKS